MSRGLGAALTLSALAHGGAVATVGLLGAAWLTGLPPAPPPAALYVDLVHPVVATSDRPAAAGAPERHVAVMRSHRHVTSSAAPVENAGIGSIAPTVESDRPVPVAPVVPPPPDAPPAPAAIGARPAPPAVTAPATVPGGGSQSPSGSVASTEPSPTMAPSPLESAPREATGDGGESPRHAFVPEVVTPAPPSDGAKAAPGSAPSSGAALRPSGDPGAGDAAQGIQVATGRDPGGPGAGSERALARLPPGDTRTDSAAGGTIPPEYESYVRALRQRIQDRLVYPWTAVRRGQQGVVELEVRVGPDGRLIAVEVVAGVSAEPLRAAAVAAVRGAAPFPFPSELAARPLVVRLPVEFRLR
jgi:periplasmic protein TonB